MKYGIYLGPTGNLFELTSVIDIQEESYPYSNEDGEFLLVTNKTADEVISIFQGEEDEMQYLLEGFEYLGKV